MILLPGETYTTFLYLHGKYIPL